MKMICDMLDIYNFPSYGTSDEALSHIFQQMFFVPLKMSETGRADLNFGMQ